jgi:hypothetical protein
MRPENNRMKQFLKANGIDAEPKYISTGTLKGSWRLYGLVNGKYDYKKEWGENHIQWWGNIELQNKINSLGFTDLGGKRVSDCTGNGGKFCIFVRGNIVLFNEETAPVNPGPANSMNTYTADRSTRRQIGLNKAAETNYRNCKRTGNPMYY